MNVLGIIPARGGSKGVPGKNIKPVSGKPLIAYSIESALNSGVLTHCYVSSDDDAILDVASAYDVQLHKRPQELASDVSPVADTLILLLQEAEAKYNIVYDAVMLLQATAPIREVFHIRESLQQLEEGVNSVISVTEMNDIHPARMYRMQEKRLSSFIPEYERARRQDIPPAYYRNGSIYIIRREALLQERQVMVKPSAPYVMDIKYLCNIDEPRDLILAEALIGAWKEGRL